MLHSSGFSGVGKFDVSWKKFLLEHVFLWSWDWGNTEKLNYCWISTMLQPFFLPEHKAPICNSVQIRNVPSVKVYFIENRQFCVFCYNPCSLKHLRKANVFELFRYSNWPFAATTGFSSSIKIGIENHTFVDADSIEKSLILIHASKFW